MEFWDPTIAAIMAIGSVLTAKQQQALLPIWRHLAEQYEKKGDIVAAHYLHALALDEFVELPPKPKLYIVKN